jgi:hypothetical protein
MRSWSKDFINEYLDDQGDLVKDANEREIFEINHTVDPEFIFYKNMGVTKQRKNFLTLRAKIWTLIILILTNGGILFLKKYRTMEYDAFNKNLGSVGYQQYDCSIYSVSEEKAYKEQLVLEKLDKNRISSSMFCYC